MPESYKSAEKNFSKKDPDVEVVGTLASSKEEEQVSQIILEPRKKTWKGYIWDSFDYPKEERWFIFKLDVTLLFAGCCGVFLRYLDQANINNAFVSGMKEELSLYGNELNIANTCWSVGYIIGQIPSSLILTKVRPHYWLPFLEISWSVLTFASSRFSTPASIYAIRFFIGFFESGHFPAIMYVTSSWYTKSELSKRMSIIQFCTGAGSMFSGYLQSAAYIGLDGIHNRSGWRWLFIIDGVISLPLAIIAFWLVPDFPRNAKKNWVFSEAEIEMARSRKPEETTEQVTFSLSSILSWFDSWHIYIFCGLFSLLSLTSQPSASLPFWFKSYNNDTHTEYTVPQINNYSTPIYAIQIVSTVFYSYLSDSLFKGKRYIIMLWCSIFQAFILVGLVVVPVHPSIKAGRWVLYYLLGAFSGSAAQAWTWVNESTLGEPVKRAFVSTMMNSVAYSFTAWVPLLLYQTKDQPYVTNGNKAAIGFSLAFGLFTAVGAFIESKGRTRGFFRTLRSVSSVDENDSYTSDIEENVNIDKNSAKVNEKAQ